MDNFFKKLEEDIEGLKQRVEALEKKGTTTAPTTTTTTTTAAATTSAAVNEEVEKASTTAADTTAAVTQEATGNPISNFKSNVTTDVKKDVNTLTDSVKQNLNIGNQTAETQPAQAPQSSLKSELITMLGGTPNTNAAAPQPKSTKSIGARLGGFLN
ncbi:hypothetical protein PPL_03841 [Heterostelium album PN500]|uniref:Uncharacterized protein n=1 Tax=Heterostelium pallidum (strain ATCC 26659 / Pp 5 / PN500) TaxID=670386 RepID=D3B6T3_HETP5|nr:hypothetical protein PPL_03841 [Heterostelium album PN500]EFA83053.1 hypothetical protein PPL_03841 [Heterostelium album PN500]|eukprot:XP_020435170.1 hypothetical protein PPL_03841 [Heterostelium album PN500]